METLNATQEQTPEIALRDYLVESKSRIDMGRILEQLKKISELNIDHFTRPSGTKLENTVQEMFSIIKDLEKHLHQMLALNASLRAELRDRRRGEENLRQAREAAEQKIAVLERDFPRVTDLEQRLEMAGEEVEKFRLLYKQEKEKLDKSEAGKRAMTARVEKTREERDDAYREIVVLADKLKSRTKADQ